MRFVTCRAIAGRRARLRPTLGWGLFVAFVTMLPPSPAGLATEINLIPRDHPRLLIHREELAALRRRCGVPAFRNAAPTSMPFAGQQAAFERVRRAADRVVRVGARTGELYAPAMAHLVLAEPGRSDPYLECVEAELRRRLEREWRDEDLAFALDWCWDDLASDIRERAVAHLARRLQPLSDAINPLDSVALRSRLCDVALAIVLFDPRSTDRASEGAARIEEVLAAARAYLEGPFVRFWQAKGPAAVSPANGISSEADAVLAAEIWQTGTGRPLWPQLADSLGRTADVYFWSYTGHAAARFGFARNEGSWAPDRPGYAPENWAAAVPWVLAARVQSGIARWFTNEYPEPAASAAGRDAADGAFAWPAVLYGDARAGTILRHACPLGRRIPEGLIVMRTDWSPDAAVVLANVGQPFWRSRQHLDAGHFQILRAGRLSTGSDEDVANDALPARGGEFFVQDRPADADSFARATIAHNCVTVWDPSQPAPRLRGRPWPVRGNQRGIEGDYELSDPPIGETPRNTGHLLAFETNSFYTYAAADLTLAYPGETVRSCVRHYLLLNAGALFVCDALGQPRPGVVTTWHLHLPERPRVAGADLRDADRVRGPGSQAGVWTLRGKDDWLDVADGEGRLFVRTLLPARARRDVVGGPAEKTTISRGPWAGLSYLGGSAQGYERRLWPALFEDAPQAWFRLGEPRSLGPQFGLRSNWGRLDVSVSERNPAATFLHVLVPVDRRVNRPPPVEVDTDEAMARVRVVLPEARVEVSWFLRALDGDGEAAGHVRVCDVHTGQVVFEDALTGQVAPDRPLPGEMP